MYGHHSQYGHFGSTIIPPNADIVYHIDVLSCVPQKPKPHDHDDHDHVPAKPIFEQKKSVESAKGLIKLLKTQIEKLQT